MKSIRPIYSALILLMAGLIILACGEDDPVVEDPNFAAPSISITSPTDLTTLETMASEPLAITMSVEAEAGLSSVFVSVDGTESTVKSYGGTETSDQINYEFISAEKGDFEIIFSIEDAMNEKVSLAPITISVVGAEDFVIADLSGDQKASVDRIINDWDTRTQYTFDVSGSLASEATIEVVNNQGRISFGMTNPDANESDDVLQVLRQPVEGFSNWGGYANVVIGFSSAIPQALIEALPVWDDVAEQMTTGTKVLAVDVYYDATVDPNFTWSDFTSLDKNQWENGDPSIGYPINLTIGKWSELNEGPDGSGHYFAYIEHLTAPNEWQTIVFDTEAQALLGNMGQAAANEVDGINIAPARAYVNAEGIDINPLYLRNLRIIEIED